MIARAILSLAKPLEFSCPSSIARCKPSQAIVFWLLVFATALVTPAPVRAATSEVCDQAAQRASLETGVPLSVLWSVTRTETGRTQGGILRPWPWTVNMEGEGHWFGSETEARNFVFSHFERGARSFDVGCFQINYKWHGASFRSIEQMFDPLENARYAAAFLLRLFHETGDWSQAAGSYHSRTPELSSKYRQRFDRIRRLHRGGINTEQQFAAADHGDIVRASPKRNNTYPLLKHSDDSRSIGSLVPLDALGTRSLFNVPRRSEGS